MMSVVFMVPIVLMVSYCEILSAIPIVLAMSMAPGMLMKLLAPWHMRTLRWS